MGILDWFKNRPAQFDPDRVSGEMIRGAVDKAITLTNPRLKLLPNCHKRLMPSVETTIEGDINLNGIFGLDKSARNGFSGVRATFRIKGDAPDEVLEQIVQQSVARSAVFDVLTNGVPVTIAAIAG